MGFIRNILNRIVPDAPLVIEKVKTIDMRMMPAPEDLHIIHLVVEGSAKGMLAKVNAMIQAEFGDDKIVADVRGASIIQIRVPDELKDRTEKITALLKTKRRNPTETLAGQVSNTELHLAYNDIVTEKTEASRRGHEGMHSISLRLKPGVHEHQMKELAEQVKKMLNLAVVKDSLNNAATGEVFTIPGDTASLIIEVNRPFKQSELELFKKVFDRVIADMRIESRGII